MNTFFNRHKRYSITLNLSIILSEVIFICLFYFFPRLATSTINKLNDPIILIDEIPITVQPTLELSQKPTPPQILISDLPEEPELLSDILTINSTESEPATGVEQSVVTASLTSLPQSPRQLLEVLPEQNSKNISGSIKFSLKIDEMGKVIDHKILHNNLKCEGCISEIIAAAYKSKWELATKGGIVAEYWVEKTYSFH
jgi:hypothetical protein